MRRAILLGSVRKSMSLLDRPDGEPVRSLRYFASLLAEVRTESFPGLLLAAPRVQPPPLRAALAARACRSGRKCPSRFGTGRSVPRGSEAPPPQRRQKGRRGDDDDLVLRYNYRGR